MGRPHKKITDWARQMILQLRHWLPDRTIVVVSDRGYAALELLHSCQSLLSRSSSSADSGSTPYSSNSLCVVDSPVTAVEGQTGMHSGDHLRYSGLVSMGKTSRTHPVGADQRPARSDED